jgi:cation diffusion facilitator family transporter
MEKGSINSDKKDKDDGLFNSVTGEKRKSHNEKARNHLINENNKAGREMSEIGEKNEEKELNEKLIHELEPDVKKDGAMDKLMGNNEENMNIRAAVIHIMGDMVQSIGVIIAAIIIKFRPDWQIADPICTFLFSILVLITTVPIFMDCIDIIMENTPKEIDVKDLYNRILRLKTVEEVHDFHCWALAGNKFIMTCHIRSNFGERAIVQINKICESQEFGIYHTTIQVETENRGAHFNTC